MQPVNTFVITARECSRALTDIRNREQPGLRSQLKGKLDEWRVEYRVTLLRVASWWAIKWVSTQGLLLLQCCHFSNLLESQFNFCTFHVTCQFCLVGNLGRR